MKNLIELSENQLDTVVGGRRHHGHGAPMFWGGRLASMLGRMFSNLNLSIIVIANSTINGNVTINTGQSINV
jgi:hypothetical protein